MGRARLDEIWSVTHAVAGRALEDAGLLPGELTRSGSPTSARRCACGTRATAGRCTGRSSGRTGAAAARCDELREAGLEPLVRERTGLVLDPVLLGDEDRVAAPQRRRAGRAGAGRAGGVRHGRRVADLQADGRARDRSLERVADAAVRHQRGAAWDAELLELFGVPERALPAVGPSSGPIGTTRADALHGHEVPVAGVAGDQQAALFGQACVDPGLGKNTYGTGSFLLQNAGYTAPDPAEGLLTTVAWRIGDGPARRTRSRRRSSSPARPSSGCATGSGSSRVAAETEELARSLEGNDGVYFVPALTGLGLAALGSVRPRHDRRADPRHRPGASGARGARVDRVPDASTRSARSRRRVRRRAGRAARRRRRDASTTG